MLDKICPKCGVKAVNVDKIKTGYFYCFPKNGGCGLRFNKVIKEINRDNDVILYSHTIFPNEFLKIKVPAYFSDWYIAKGLGGSEFSDLILNIKSNADEAVVNEISDIVYRNLEDIIYIEHLKDNLTDDIIITTVPRSKPDNYYEDKQLKFREAVNIGVGILGYESVSSYDFIECAGSIERIKETLTTHKKSDMSENSGPAPYPGITKDTCILSSDIGNKTVILVDDIYTYGVGIDEDCIQFLYDFGANNVILYTLGMTQKSGNYTQQISYDKYLEIVKNK